MHDRLPGDDAGGSASLPAVHEPSIAAAPVAADRDAGPATVRTVDRIE